jgi:hypothetical protein
MFQTKVVQKIKTHISCSMYFFSENRAVCEIILKNVVQPDSPQVTIQHGACALPQYYVARKMPVLLGNNEAQF